MTLSTVWVLAAQLASATMPAGPTDTILVGQARAPTSQTAVARREPQAFDASRFDSLTATALRALFDDAAAAGLPVRPLVNRALEGAARRTTSERILRVVREHALALRDAKQALGERSTDDELEAGAIALRAGLDRRALELVRGSRPKAPVVVPLVVPTDLVRRGVPAATAQEAVAALGRAPRADDALLGLQATVAKNAQRGPGMAVDALHRYVKAVIVTSPDAATSTSSDRKPVRPPAP